MNHVAVGILGGVVMTVGALLVVFNRRIDPQMRRTASRVELWRRVMDDLPGFQPSDNGRTPALTLVGVGWILVGAVFLFVAITRQPL